MTYVYCTLEALMGRLGDTEMTVPHLWIEQTRSERPDN